MKCKICGNPMSWIFNGKILEKYEIAYFSCSNCNFVCTEEPYWLAEAYSEPINITDTGLIGRNINLSKIVSILCFSFFKNKKFLDYGAGYGILVE